MIAFYLYEAAGGVAYDDDTLRALLDLPEVIGIKVATLDSVMTFHRHPKRSEGFLPVRGKDSSLRSE